MRINSLLARLARAKQKPLADRIGEGFSVEHLFLFGWRLRRRQYKKNNMDKNQSGTNQHLLAKA